MTRPRRSHKPARPQTRRPEVIRVALDNGLSVIVCPRPHLSQTYAAVFFGVGSRHETPANNGITHMLEHMLFRGTQSHPDSTALNRATEELGGFLEGATYRDHVNFATGCHPSREAAALSILGELVQTPRYRSVDVERSILREELLETLDQSGRMIDLDNIAHRSVFGDKGLGLPIEGTLGNVERTTVADLEAHRRRFLVGSNGVVSVVGPLDPDRTVARIRRAFGRMPAGSVPQSQAPAPPRAAPILRYVRDASSQVDIRISFRAVSMSHPSYPALGMLGRLLADGLSSRMHAELVDRRGLAYALQAGLTTYRDCGLFEFDVSVGPHRAAEAVATILSFARSAGRFRFSPDELSRTRRRYRYGVEFMEDSAVDLSSWYGRGTLFGVDREIEALGRRFLRVTDSEIRRAAREAFRPEGLVLTAAGELARGEWRRIREVVAEWSDR